MNSNNKPTLTISVVAKTELYCVTSACLTQALDDFRFSSQFNVVQSLCIGQSDLPKARSCQMTSWYNNAKKGDFFMFIDADQIFKTSDIVKTMVLAKQHDIVCGAYPRKNGEMTVEPMNIRQFRRDKEGPLFYGATGFMTTTYESVSKMVNTFEKIRTSRQDFAYPFFYERIIEEKESSMEGKLWLGEDYSFCWYMRSIGGTVYGFISDSIGHILTYEKYLNIAPEYKWPEKSIAIYCSQTVECWSAKSLERGIGGSETAIINLAKLWVENGYSVNVFCVCDVPGVYEGVTYQNFDSFKMSDIFDILIIWRNPTLLNLYCLEARKIILDLHDIVNPAQFTKNLIAQTDKIFVKSEYHKTMLGNIDENKIAVVTNGGADENVIEKSDEKSPEKDHNYLIYSSSYDRGLINMLKWGWPKIRSECPNARLGIFYGWDCYDRTHGKTSESIKFKSEMIELMNQPGIEHKGRVSNEVLMQHKKKASIHYYTGNFQEIDCISVRESASVGTIPIVSEEVKVFQEKNYCIKIPGDPNTQKMQENAACKIIELLQNVEKMEHMRKSIVVPKNETWRQVALTWKKYF